MRAKIMGGTAYPKWRREAGSILDPAAEFLKTISTRRIVAPSP